MKYSYYTYIIGASTILFILFIGLVLYSYHNTQDTTMREKEMAGYCVAAFVCFIVLAVTLNAKYKVICSGDITPWRLKEVQRANFQSVADTLPLDMQRRL